MVKQIECPTCTDGKVLAVPPARKTLTGDIQNIPPIDCPDCEGTGTVTIEEKWISHGKELKTRRIKNKYTLRSFCMKFDLDPVEVSRIERGLQQASKEIRKSYQELAYE